jgi:hypothetical protein
VKLTVRVTLGVDGEPRHVSLIECAEPDAKAHEPRITTRYKGDPSTFEGVHQIILADFDLPFVRVDIQDGASPGASMRAGTDPSSLEHDGSAVQPAHRELFDPEPTPNAWGRTSTVYPAAPPIPPDERGFVHPGPDKPDAIDEFLKPAPRYEDAE